MGRWATYKVRLGTRRTALETYVKIPVHEIRFTVTVTVSSRAQAYAVGM